MFRKSLLALSIFSTVAFAADPPGGVMRTAANATPGSYEILLSPSQTFSPNGAHLSTEFRYQPNEDIGVGAGFGAGQIGFHLGTNGTWFIAPDLPEQPAFALTGGLYFQEFQTARLVRPADDYIVLKVVPTVSKSFYADWGNVTPYAGFQVSTAFGLGGATDVFGLKASTGAQLQLKSTKNMKFNAEFGVGVLNTFHELALGVTYTI